MNIVILLDYLISIGLSVVCLEKIEGSKIFISTVDIVDGTPLLDIEPYIPDFDKHKDEEVRIE